MKKSRIFAGLAAAVLAASMMAVSAGASEPEQEPVATADPGTNYTAVAGTTTTFDKYLVMKKDAVVPTASFTFTVAPGTAVAAANGKMPVLAGPEGVKFTVYDETDNPDDDNVGTAETAKLEFASADDTVAEAEVGTKTVKFTTSNDTSDEKFAMKTLTLDFSEVEFTEPGVYRYIITEGEVTGVAGVTADATAARTLDVYVVDATDGNGKKLSINSYVLHEDLEAPGRNVLNEAGTAYVTDGGKDDDKSTGFTNTYDSNNLSFSKTVTGNQGSKDQYFAFTLTINNAAGATVNVVGQGETFDAAPKANSATEYSADTMAAANAADDDEAVTGQQFTADNGTINKTIYLQHGQSVKIEGIPAGASYTIAEVNEDYDVTTVVEGDTANGETSIASGTAATVTDALLTADTTVAFTNNKTGAIPTGVILSIAAPACVALAVVGGIVLLKIKRSREDDEE